MEPDDQLLARSSVDLAAFEEFYRRNVDRIVRWAARRTREPGDVADLVADIFVAALESAPRFDPVKGQALPWLYGVAGNVWSARMRRWYRDRALDARISGRRLLDDTDIERLEARIDAERRQHELLQSLRALPARQRRVLELVAVDGLTTDEAAAALGITPMNARARLSRARRRMRQSLLTQENTASTDPERAPPSARASVTLPMWKETR